MAKKHPAEAASKTMAFETLEKKVLLSSGEEPEDFQLDGKPTTSLSDPDASEEYNATSDDETMLGRTDCCDLLTGECYVAPQQDTVHAACSQQLEEMDEHLMEPDPLAASNGGTYPTPADVRQGYGVAEHVVPWPSNPYAPEQELVPGIAIGEYEYRQLDGGAAYSLTGHLDNGAFVVP